MFATSNDLAVRLRRDVNVPAAEALIEDATFIAAFDACEIAALSFNVAVPRIAALDPGAAVDAPANWRARSIEATDCGDAAADPANVELACRLAFEPCAVAADLLSVCVPFIVPMPFSETALPADTVNELS